MHDYHQSEMVHVSKLKEIALKHLDEVSVTHGNVANPSTATQLCDQVKSAAFIH